MKKIKPYLGTMNTRAMDKLTGRAYGAWNGQMQRCNNKLSKSYKNYGAKGVRVEYQAREFMGWWLSEHKRKKWARASVGRIDHSKNYSFDNIEMVEHAQNAREMYYRTGGNITVVRVPVVLFNDNECVAFYSRKLAAKHANISEPMIKMRQQNPVNLNTVKSKLKYNVYTLDQFMEL